jgi:hypothetical protein
LGDFLLNIVLSNVVIFIIMGIVLVMLTNWALRLREIPGYILGWLTGIFIIILLSVLSPSAEVVITDPMVSAPIELTFLGVIIPSFIGLVLGVSVLSLVRFGSNTASRIGRALTIAVLVAITLISAYLMLQLALAGRLSIAIFLLTFGIGALIHYIFRRGTPEASSLRTRLPFRNDL